MSLPIKDGQLDLLKLLPGIASKIQSQFPDTFRSYYPRKFLAAGGWYSPRMAAALMTMNEAAAGKNSAVQEDSTLMLHVATAMRLRKLGMPTYWISKELCLALMRTKPPEDLLFGDIKWPLDGMMIMMPENTMEEPGGGYVMSIQMASPHCSLDTTHKDQLTSMEFSMADLQCVFTANTSSGSAWSCHNPVTEKVNVESEFTSYTPQETVEFMEELGVNTESNPVNDSNFSVTVLNRFCVNLLMYLTQLNDGIEGLGEISLEISKRANPNKNQKDRDALWTTPFIGRTYQSKRSASKLSDANSSHLSPRIHWRMGHWRRQPYGKIGNETYRHIFIDPVLVNAE